MNEIDKMRNSQLADMEKPEIQASFIYAKKLVAQLRMMSTYDDGFREVLEELVPGFTKEQFEKVAEAGMSDAQLYKQAGNSITVNVVEAIARNLLKFDEEENANEEYDKNI